MAPHGVELVIVGQWYTVALVITALSHPPHHGQNSEDMRPSSTTHNITLHLSPSKTWHFHTPSKWREDSNLKFSLPVRGFSGVSHDYFQNFMNFTEICLCCSFEVLTFNKLPLVGLLSFSTKAEMCCGVLEHWPCVRVRFDSGRPATLPAPMLAHGEPE